MSNSESGLSEKWQIIGGLLILIAFAFRILWQVNPSPLSCILFWVAMMMWGVLWVIDNKYRWSKIAKSVSLCGAALNATVTIANGGYMPVLSVESFSIWVQSTEVHKLMFLADIYSGFSIGDIVLASGAVLAFGGWIMRKFRKENYAIN